MKGDRGDTDERRPRAEAAAGRSAAAREAHRKMCALFDACRGEGSPRGIRDAALLSVLYGASVPRDTALRLPLEAWDVDRGVLRWTPPGPGSPRRARRATDGAREALDDWLRIRGTAPGPLLCRLQGRERAPGPLDGADVVAVLEHWSVRSGVEDLDEEELLRLYTSPWWEDLEGEAPEDPERTAS